MVSCSIFHRDRPVLMIFMRFFSLRGRSVTQEKRVVLGLGRFLVPGLVSCTSKKLIRTSGLDAPPLMIQRAQNTARALLQILQSANISFAILGNKECCTRNSACRSGNEYLFSELASHNIATLNEV